MSFCMGAFSVFSFFCIEDEKILCMLCGIGLGFLFLILSTFRIEYDDSKISMKLYAVKKVIEIREIKEIGYSGIPNVCCINTCSEIFYMPTLFMKRKLEKLFKYIENINPDVRIYFKFGFFF